MQKIKFSHSKLTTILNCPMSYHLRYELGISPKFTKPALSIGSAVHFGLENNNSSCLDEYYLQYNNYKQDEKILAKAMVDGFLLHKPKIFEKILGDAKLLDEQHELYVTGKLKSNLVDYNEFVGIIDLLLTTNKGFIIVDYKTSSRTPEWSTYLDQLYRYCFLLKQHFPEIPILKIAIINLKKSKISRKYGENDESFYKRIFLDYELNEESNIDCHIYNSEEFLTEELDSYIENLARMCDCALSIVNSKSYYINYNTIDDYGGSDLKELLLNHSGAYTLYNIKDKCYNPLTGKVEETRDMRQIDTDCIYGNAKEVTCRYSNFLDTISLYKQMFNTSEVDKDLFFDFLSIEWEGLEIDKELLEDYWLTYEIESK